ncbi:MAG: NUDIX hydrolase [Planctomycetota bacterium]
MKHRWERRGGKIVYDAGIFRVRVDEYQFRGRPASHPFHVLETNDWVNVVPITSQDEIVMVRQYRHGVEEVCLEIPGGMIDDTDPDPAAAAVRELAEETGYGGDEPRPLGSVSSNPAILANRTYTYWIGNAEPVAPPQPDEHEDFVLELCPVREVPDLIARGEIHHSLSVVALLRYLHLREA